MDANSKRRVNFDTVAIVGVGLIGGSIGMALKERRLARRVVGIGRRPSSLALARRRGAIDTATTHLGRGVADAELTILCTPVDTIPRQAIEVATCCPPRAILTDAGSTKANIVAQLENGLRQGISFVGGHPMAGSEQRGVEVARGDLFQGRVCVITPTPHTPGGPLAKVEKLWRALGARVIRMSPEEHDRAVAYSSHLPHLVAAALSLTLPDNCKEVVASGFRDTTRIAASDPHLWTAIFVENYRPLIEALTKYESTLNEFRKAIERRDARKLLRLWTDSKAKRDMLKEALAAS